MQNKTKDEKFVISLYESALQAEEIDVRLNRYEIGAKVGIQPKAVDAICKLLIQANFIKKDGEKDIFLTQNGIQLAQRLLRE